MAQWRLSGEASRRRTRRAAPMSKTTPKPRRKMTPQRVLALPDLEQAKAAVLNSLTRDIG